MFRFRLKTMLLLMALAALSLGWRTNAASRQRRAVEAIANNDGGVAYTFNRRPNNQPPPPPAWMMHRDVRDYLFDVIGVLLLRDADFADSDLEVLLELPKLTELTLEGGHFTDEAIQHLVQMRNLCRLSLIDTSISDEGALRVAALNNLEQLSIESDVMTNDGCARRRQAMPNCRIVR